MPHAARWLSHGYPVFRSIIPHAETCLSHGISVFHFFIPCSAYFYFLSQAFPFFAPLSSAHPAQAGSLPDAYRHFTVPMRMHNDIPMCRYPYFNILICGYPCSGIPICHLSFRRRSGKIKLKGENHIVKETQENTSAETKGMSPAGGGTPENGEQERNSAAGFAPVSGQQGAGLEPQAMNRGRQASCQEQQAADRAQHSPSGQQSAPRGKPEEAVSPEQQLQAAEAQLAALKQQLHQAEEQRLLRERQLLLTAALQEQLTPVCGREMAEELSRLMCAGADLSAHAGTKAADRIGEAGKEGAEAEENAPWSPAPMVEHLRAAWPACFSAHAPLKGLEPVTPPLPAAAFEPKELSDREYYDRLYKPRG